MKSAPYPKTVERRLGQRIAQERRSQNLSYEKLATKIQLNTGEVITSRTIRNLEDGKRMPTVRTLKLVLGTLAQVPPEELDDFFFQLLTGALIPKEEKTE